MPRSQRTELLEKIKAILSPGGGTREVDCAVQLQVWRRKGDGDPYPSELLPRVYGGRYDRLLRRFVGPAGAPKVLRVHEGQAELILAALDGTHRHVLALGAPGGGKTLGAVAVAVCLACLTANDLGGVIAPTQKRLLIVWRDFLRVAKPLGLIDQVREATHEVRFNNRTWVQFLAAKRPDERTGTPLQGWSWSWVVPDESQSNSDDVMDEIEYRGRRVGDRYRVIETATNAQIGVFQRRLARYKCDPATYHIIRYAGEKNVFVPTSHWKQLARVLSKREYAVKVLCEDLPPENLLYPAFDLGKNLHPRPQVGTDITAKLVADRYGVEDRRWIVGQDFGVLRTVSIFLKCYLEHGQRIWYACDEITSYEGTTAQMHARKILDRYNKNELIVLPDPHINTADVDKSDYAAFRTEGLIVKLPVAPGKKISIRHRVAMLNGLLCNADGAHRFFVECDEGSLRNPRCPKLVDAFMGHTVPEDGCLRQTRKDYRDLSHWPDAAGYGLFPFERLSAGAAVQLLGLTEDEDSSAGNRPQRRHAWDTVQ